MANDTGDIRIFPPVVGSDRAGVSYVATVASAKAGKISQLLRFVSISPIPVIQELAKGEIPRLAAGQDFSPG
jgi:hypothetical protein